MCASVTGRRSKKRPLHAGKWAVTHIGWTIDTGMASNSRKTDAASTTVSSNMDRVSRMSVLSISAYRSSKPVGPACGSQPSSLRARAGYATLAVRPPILPGSVGRGRARYESSQALYDRTAARFVRMLSKAAAALPAGSEATPTW